VRQRIAYRLLHSASWGNFGVYFLAIHAMASLQAFANQVGDCSIRSACLKRHACGFRFGAAAPCAQGCLAGMWLVAPYSAM
jgi:hypothetical protein